MKRLVSVFSAAWLFVACGTAGQTTFRKDGVKTTTPTSASELEAYLPSRPYADWPAESAAHQSTGPHGGRVRTWLSPTANASLTAGNSTHTFDSVLVKELYGSNTDGTLIGYAVMVKIKEGAADDSWYWYESFTNGAKYEGVGLALCANCHRAGRDFVLTPFPLQ